MNSMIESESNRSVWSAIQEEYPDKYSSHFSVNTYWWYSLEEPGQGTCNELYLQYIN